MRTVSIDGQSVEREKIKPLILDACIEVLKTHGQNGLTMSRIARQTGIAKGTLYNYFANKEDLLKSACECFGQPLLNKIWELLATDMSPRDVLVIMLTAKINAFRQYRRVIEAFLSLSGQDSFIADYEPGSFKAQIIELLNRLFEKAKADGYNLPFPVSVMAEIYDGATTGMSRCMPREADGNPGSFPTEAEIEKFVDIFLPKLPNSGI